MVHLFAVLDSALLKAVLVSKSTRFYIFGFTRYFVSDRDSVYNGYLATRVAFY